MATADSISLCFVPYLRSIVEDFFFFTCTLSLLKSIDKSSTGSNTRLSPQPKQQTERCLDFRIIDSPLF